MLQKIIEGKAIEIMSATRQGSYEAIIEKISTILSDFARSLEGEEMRFDPNESPGYKYLEQIVGRPYYDEIVKALSIEKNHWTNIIHNLTTSLESVRKENETLRAENELLHSVTNTQSKTAIQVGEKLVEVTLERDELKAEVERLRSVLDRIANWDMPESGRTWDDGEPMSYGAAYGSNGERDYIKSVANKALKPQS